MVIQLLSGRFGAEEVNIICNQNAIDMVQDVTDVFWLDWYEDYFAST